MKAAVFAPLHIHEAADAPEFQREAHAFCQAVGIQDAVHLFDNKLGYTGRLGQVRAWLDAKPADALDTLVFVCHGWKTGLQFGVQTATAAKLAESVKRCATPALTVLLYACTTGSDNDGNDGNDTDAGPGGEGGMADALRDAFLKAGVRATVYAHATRGHCTRNPYVRRFDPAEVAGGNWVVEPHSELWNKWVHRLADDHAFRFRFPFMTAGELEFELRGMPGDVA